MMPERNFALQQLQHPLGLIDKYVWAKWTNPVAVVLFAIRDIVV